jgi:hypothetical protein
VSWGSISLPSLAGKPSLSAGRSVFTPLPWIEPSSPLPKWSARPPLGSSSSKTRESEGAWPWVDSSAERVRGRGDGAS